MRPRFPGPPFGFFRAPPGAGSPHAFPFAQLRPAPRTHPNFWPPRNSVAGLHTTTRTLDPLSNVRTLLSRRATRVSKNCSKNARWMAPMCGLTDGGLEQVWSEFGAPADNFDHTTPTICRFWRASGRFGPNLAPISPIWTYCAKFGVKFSPHVPSGARTPLQKCSRR